MDIVYLLENKRICKKYIGSKKNWKGDRTYFGSPSCSKFHPKYFWQQEWIKDSKENTEAFKMTILDSFDLISLEELVKREKERQLEFNAIKSEDFINAGYASIRYSGGESSFKNKTYDQIYGFRSLEQKIKRSSSLMGKKRNPEIGKKIAAKLKGKSPWNKGLTRKEDDRVESYASKIKRVPAKIYKILIDDSNIVEIKGKKNFSQFISEFNKSVTLKQRINIDKLIKFKKDKQMKLL